MESRTKSRKSGEILRRMVWKAFPEEHPMLAEATEPEGKLLPHGRTGA